MKPFLLLLFAIGLAAVKPTHAQKNEITPSVIVNKEAVDAKEKHARLDTGIVSVAISWNSYGWACGYSQVNILPARQPGAAPIMSKVINTMSTCTSAVAFTGLLAGMEITVEVICSSGFRAYSAPGYVHAGWPPLLLEVSFPE